MAETTEQKRSREKEIVLLMIRLFCKGKHGSRGGQLCPECRELAAYALQRVERCPHMDTKTFCSACSTHCYKPDMQARIRRVMGYSGPRMLLYHPLMTVRHGIERLRQ